MSFVSRSLHAPLNPLSAIWRIYPSSKWSSQWPYDGYIRHGWMTSCGRGRDSATRESFGRGSRGTIFVRSSKLSLFFPEIWPFRRVFLFPALLKDLAPNVEALGHLLLTMSWRSFWKLRSVTGHFLRTPTTTTSNFWKFSFFFPKSRCFFPDSYGDPQAEQSTLAMVRQKLEWKLDRPPALVRSSAEGPSTVVAIGTSHVRWPIVQREKKKHNEASVWSCEVSTHHHLQTREFWAACFRDPMSQPFCTSLLSCTWMYSCRTVRLQRGESEEKQSSVTFPVLITEA